MSKFDETLTFIGEIERAATPDAVCQRLLTIRAQVGLDKLVAGTLGRHLASQPERDHRDQPADRYAVHRFCLGAGVPEGARIQ